MINSIKQYLSNKKILILGFGVEGRSTFALLRNIMPEQPLTIADIDPKALKKANLAVSGLISFQSGNDYLNNTEHFDLIIKSPGVSVKDLNLESHITSQTELFMQSLSKQIIGITGTKGKSTTASLIFSIIKLHSENSVLVGNIGIPPFDLIPSIDNNTIVVAEFSSHQLEHITKSPHISVLLNLYQDHLDHYNSFTEYLKAKFNIINFQGESDILIYNDDNELIKHYIEEIDLKQAKYAFSAIRQNQNGCYLNNDEEIVFSAEGQDRIIMHKADIPIMGIHNMMNVMAAISTCMVLGITTEVIRYGIKSFKGLEHRIEYVGKYHGIQYYNDSIATVPEATIYAIKALQNVDTLILGGYDRGIDYKRLATFLNESQVGNFIFMGNAGEKICELMKKGNSQKKTHFMVSNLADAITISKSCTLQDAICLLSPAAASYDVFTNYKEKGQLFKSLVRQ
jgi:UDP-N-acetylmuramoylalanine--D-glutamate ligase